jgi:hypothetical protein
MAKLPDGVVLAEDETHVNLLAWVRATWIPHGQRQEVMTPGKNWRHSIFGAVDLAFGPFFSQVTRKAVSATFTAFCEQLLAADPTAPVVAGDLRQRDHPPLQDRATLAGQAPQAAGAAGGALQPTRQHDNPVERIWGALKAWPANNPTLTIQGRVR